MVVGVQNCRISCTTQLVRLKKHHLKLIMSPVSHHLLFPLQMWCGPTSCHVSAKGRGGCSSGQTCVPIRESHCFVKPCPDFGECSNFPPPPSKCYPGSCYQDNSCANITFTFNKETMPQVSESEGFVVIFMPLQHGLSENRKLWKISPARAVQPHLYMCGEVLSLTN